MAVVDIARLEEKIDRTAAGATEIRMDLGGIQFKSMIELMEFSKLMAVSGAAVPVHLRGNAGACLAICTRALRFGFDPFSLAEHSFLTVKKTKDGNNWVDVETVAYDSFVIHAIIEAHAPLTGRLRITYQGEGDDRTCTVTATPRGEKEPLIHTGPTLGQLKAMRGRNDRGQIKGSPLWDGPKSDQQQAYDARRDFCRKFFPEILLGWYDKAELEESAARAATDVTPKPDLASRLNKNAKARGFSEEHVSRQLEHDPGQTLPEITPTPQASPVEVHPEKEMHPSAELALDGDAENEVRNKKLAVEAAESIDDLKQIVSATTSYLKKAKRTDLLSDFLSAAKAKEKKLEGRGA